MLLWFVFSSKHNRPTVETDGNIIVFVGSWSSNQSLFICLFICFFLERFNGYSGLYPIHKICWDIFSLDLSVRPVDKNPKSCSTNIWNASLLSSYSSIRGQMLRSLITSSNVMSDFISNPGPSQPVASLWSPNILTFDPLGGLVYSQS